MTAFSERIPFPIQAMLYRQLMSVIKRLVSVLPIRRPEVFVGPGSSLLLCDAIAASGVRHVLIVTDAMLVKIGLIEPFVQRLGERGIDVTVYDGVEPDPTIPQIELGARRLAESGSDAVLAIGGGSALDAAKVIAACGTNKRSVRQMTGFFTLRHATLPLFAVPTTAGTGAEVTLVAVMSDPDQHNKKVGVLDPKVIPSMVALDGRLMTGLPPAVTAAGGMDALTHAIEAYLSRLATPETDRAALEAASLILRYLPMVMADGRNESARQMMAWAAYKGGLAITKAAAGYVHAIAHRFGGLYHTPHGLANAIVLPYVLEFSKPACTERLADLARAGGLDDGSTSSAVLADLFIERVRTLNRELGIPDRLAALREEDLPLIATEALEEAHFTYGIPRYMDHATCQALVRRMLPT